MKVSSGYRIALSAVLLLGLSGNAQALLESDDWKTPGDNLITRDTDSGLEWLDLTATSNLSYDYVSARLGIGEEFEGFRYANGAEVATLWTNAGGTAPYDGYSTANDGLFDILAPLFGDLAYEAGESGVNAVGEGYSRWLTADSQSAGNYWAAMSWDLVTDSDTANQDFFKLTQQTYHSSASSALFGSALVRESSTVVPLPAAVWLLGAGLFGYLGVGRVRRSVN